MKPLVRFCVSLLLLCALLEGAQPNCDSDNRQCSGNETETFTTDTKSISLESDPTCNLSSRTDTTGQGSLSDLTPGAVYPVFFGCFNCCKEITTKPEAVRDLSVSEITTSSVSLTWTKPNGNSSLYRVYWTDETNKWNKSTNETNMNVTGLTAGVEYTFTVSAVADDGQTEGENSTKTRYTKPGVVTDLRVHNVTTSSMFLTWTKPEGQSPSYKVQWTDEASKTVTETKTSINITDLTAGVQYDISVTAVAGDNTTEGESSTVSRYTKPALVDNLNAVDITTSSMFLNWTEPRGESPSFRVQWKIKNGKLIDTVNVTETSINITDLTAGVQYDTSVTAVAGDNTTEGESSTVSKYTKPAVVDNLSAVEITTSSVCLNWTKPEGENSFYRVQWENGDMNQTKTVTETSINITGLTAGVQYDISVTAVAGDNTTEGESSTVSKYTKPAVVDNLSAVEITTSSMFLNWTEPRGERSFYRVQWRNGDMNKTKTVTDTSINITGLTAGVQYDISVTAVAGDNTTEGESSTVSKYTKPAVVNNLSAIEITTSSMFLNWTKPRGESPSFRVQWKIKNGKLIDTVNVTETSINITGLTAGVQYDISVTAVAGDNTTEGESSTVSKYTKPAVVDNLSAVEITTSSVCLNWTKPEGENSFYRVQWENGDMNQTKTVTETSINITGLTAGVQYDISVTAVAGDNTTEGESSTVSKYTKPALVDNLHAVDITTSSVCLNWTKPEGENSFYRVQWENGDMNQTKTVTETSINITGLTAGVQYDISVTAVAGDNQTEGQSSTVSIYTKPAVVDNLSAVEITTSSMFLNWTEPRGERSFYRVQWRNGDMNKTKTVTDTSINITGLTAGVQYDISVTAVAGDNTTEGESSTVSKYTKPAVVNNLSAIEITTSSMFLNWTKPRGESPSFRVQWKIKNGKLIDTVNVTETSINITDLTAGVQYDISVTAVAGDNTTEGESSTVSKYTKPGVVRDLSVSNVTTSSMFLSWTEPEGKRSTFRVQWKTKNGKFIETENVTETQISITGLTAGVHYEMSVTAVAGDGQTRGQSSTVSKYTKPGKVGSHTSSVTNYTISLNWKAPPGDVSEYRVDWHNGGTEMSNSTTSTFAKLSDLIPGTTYTIQITAVNGAHETGEPYIFTVVTKPAVVNNLIITGVTTTSVTLEWSKPKGNATSYIVQWLEGVKSLNDSTNETSLTIDGLTPGYEYSITVVAVSESPSNTGEGTSTSTFTKPVKPVNITVGPRGTDNLNIAWVLSEGRVDHYVVHILNKELMFSNNKTSKNTTVLFTGLYPGRVFVVTVTAEAGAHREMSDESQFATYPTPPGAIVITRRTNSSLHLGWATPALMENAPDVIYHVTYISSMDGAEKNESMVNKTDLLPLLAGTSYNISVKTIGPQGLTSSAVHTSTFTSPNPVLNLISHPKSISSVEVKWSPPREEKDYYTYYVQTHSPTGTPINRTVSTNSADLSDLESGTRYSISVRTIAAPGIESTEEFTSSYTKPTAVANVKAENVTTTSVRLSWSRQSDYKQSYSYLVMALHGAMRVHNDSTKTETYTFTNLCPGRLYTFKVITEVDGVESSVANTTSYTKPPVVSDILVTGDTTKLSVSWMAAECQVESFTVRLLRGEELVGNGTDLSNTTVNKVFEGLKPGVLYCAEVITESGPFRNTSPRVCNATFPNPPGPITVASQTVDSINFTWSLPENMDHMQYNFSVTTSNGSSLTTDRWFLLKGLLSGSPYNISVVTVGVNNFESTEVTARNYTRPYPAEVLAKKTEINPTTVTLFWEQKEIKPHYSYVVKASNNAPPETVDKTTKTISGLLSGTNYSFTVITQTEDGTQADPETVSFFTRPHGVRHLQAKTLNTTAVRLSWTDPMEYKPEYRYQVETTGCDTFKNINSTVNNTVISELTQGTECTFCVFVRAGDGIKGEANCISQYTEPETVQPSISSQGSNSSILVSWTKPQGRVDNFSVSLTSTSESGIQLNSSATSYLFENLSAGRVYFAVVSTLSGPFKRPSVNVTNATFPNPPGPISVLEKTTNSLEIKWEGAPQMSGASFFYQLTNISAKEGNFISTTSTSHTFSSLLSGTSYNISVATVGASDFQSAKVYRHMVTTRPFGVGSVRTTVEEEIINVTWDIPVQYKDSYRFILTRQSSEGNVSDTAKENTYNFTKLVPGSPYNISVTTETSDGTQSNTTWKSVCTKASPGTNFVCEGPNKTNAEVILTWKCPRGRYSSFKVYVDDNDHSTSSQCNLTVPNLRHYTEYKLTVETQSCGPASNQTVRCRTGITNPPSPGNLNLLVKVMEREHDRFTLNINSSLLNNTNGPIRYVGVLVMNENTDTSDFRSYLEKTHAQWDAGNTPAYLATVREINLQSRSEDAQLVIVVGDSSIWKGYTNGALKANRNYQLAIVLFTDLKLQSQLVNGAQSLVSVTQFSTVVFLPVNPAVIGLAVGATLGIFSILFFILIGFIIYWRRLSKKKSPDIQINPIRAKSVAVKVEDFEAYYKKQKADSNCGFAEEFEDLKTVGTGQTKTNALAPENKSKNRYNNVLPYDHSRVKLSIIHGSPHDDYINANYMPGYNSRKEFIAAQGPLPQTVNEFWRMIWEKNVQTLVMLTRCNEQGRVKCEQYWEHGTKHFENIIVTMTSEIPLKDWTIRDFDVKNVKTAETRSVRHFHFTAWPDHGVPETTELLISFRHLVREHMDQYSRHSPAVVHCSAGVGRTGTLIAIDRLINQIERENTVDVYGIVHDLRMHRPLMVQTEDQYVFLNQCALDIIRSRTGTNVDLIYQNIAAISIYENVEPKKGHSKNGY
ncbi:receptor-type tyrosine-protein phosphatase beta isoform X4 [Cheilinus undulatus]|uniref:receptor-type tyrosine-protein phosphatase beta isoform X4 n=1 Tax=Cheilinus undulatus TaxID=241271 RepID=UPI001BD39C6E|nr:receptor-type tyrosine-protein phosphatase beta isoform X4 [Cheilinus undulatus]